MRACKQKLSAGVTIMNGSELTWVALVGAFAGIFLPLLAKTHTRYRYRKIVSCPETHRDTEVLLEAVSSNGRVRVKVRDCTLWPEKKGCAQRCVKRV